MNDEEHQYCTYSSMILATGSTEQDTDIHSLGSLLRRSDDDCTRARAGVTAILEPIRARQRAQTVDCQVHALEQEHWPAIVVAGRHVECRLNESNRTCDSDTA
jgi:hypothetical protein